MKTKEEVYDELMKDRDNCGEVGKAVIDFLCDGLLVSPEEFKRQPHKLSLPRIFNIKKSEKEVIENEL